MATSKAASGAGRAWGRSSLHRHGEDSLGTLGTAPLAPNRSVSLSARGHRRPVGRAVRPSPPCTPAPPETQVPARRGDGGVAGDAKLKRFSPGGGVQDTDGERYEDPSLRADVGWGPVPHPTTGTDRREDAAACDRPAKTCSRTVDLTTFGCVSGSGVILGFEVVRPSPRGGGPTIPRQMTQVYERPRLRPGREYLHTASVR